MWGWREGNVLGNVWGADEPDSHPAEQIRIEGHALQRHRLQAQNGSNPREDGEMRREAAPGAVWRRG